MKCGEAELESAPMGRFPAQLLEGVGFAVRS